MAHEPEADERRVVYVPLDEIVGAPRNPKSHDLEGIRKSFARFGLGELPMRDERTGRLVAGHGRIEELHVLRANGDPPPRYVRVDDDGRWLVPVQAGWSSANDAEAEGYLLASNRLTETGGYNDELLAELLREQMNGPGLDGLGYDPADLDALLHGLDPSPAAPTGPSLHDRFGVPPFSVLDARAGYWQTRKREWLSLGLRSEDGRDGDLLWQSPGARDPQFYGKKRAAEAKIGRSLTTAEFVAEHYRPPRDRGYVSGTSVFDPVLAELAYRWFSPPGGTVVDPFAGGVVRGVVAAVLGRRYVGVDLSAGQVEANREQATALLAGRDPDATPVPDWRVGDARDVVPGLELESADLVFTCPPYYDLEVYSDDPRDLSRLGRDAFDAAYAEILAASAAVLRPDRFAVVVVGNVRDPDGSVRDLAAITGAAAAAAGLSLVNDAVLVTPVAMLAARAAPPFLTNRTLGRGHQSVLVFVRGDRTRATAACGPIDLPADLDENVHGA